MRERAILALEDGKVFHGYRFGHDRDGEGEVVFNTSMTGYQEICTDASYHGQMVVFTYPLIGNYGVNANDTESRIPWVAGVLVREYCADYSNWGAEGALHSYLSDHLVPGLFGMDTRALTRHLRTHGTMRGVITSFSGAGCVPEAIERARHVTPVSQKNLVGEASSEAPRMLAPFVIPGEFDARRVAVIDCGTKHNILRSLRQRGAELIVLPYDVTDRDVLELKPHGVVFSNGPGDPATLPVTIECARGLLSAGLPILGICLGHQMLAHAMGGTTSRLKFGHHGGNHPVKDLTSGRVYITSQNHEFQVDATSISPESGFFVSHVNLNDNSVEGLAHRQRPVFSVQYHPEGSPGPQDNQYIFDKFMESILAEERR